MRYFEISRYRTDGRPESDGVEPEPDRTEEERYQVKRYDDTEDVLYRPPLEPYDDPEDY